MNNFSQSLQAKLLMTLVAGLMLIMAVVLISIFDMKGSISGYQALHEGESLSQMQVSEINVTFKRQVQEWKNVLLRGSDSSSREEYWSRFLALDAKVKSLSLELMQKLPSGSAKEDMVRFTSSHGKLLSQYKRGLSTFESSGFDHKKADAVVSGIDREPSQLLSSLSERMYVEGAKKAQLYMENSEKSVWIVIGGLVFVSIVVLFGMNYSLRSQFIRPLQDVIVDIDRVSSGDFTYSSSTNYGGELGELNQSLNKMKQNLGGMIAGILTTADVLRQASQEFKASADAITQDTSRAESFSEQIATAISQMSATVTEVASNAANAADATQIADKSAKDGLMTMEGAIAAISNVASEVCSISEDMSKLEQDTTSVGAVLDVIKGIAEQTNLLALNAAIEAARAGEQGRGFAVVADEVRALAKRTQESTEEIQHIIETVQTGAASAAQAMQAGNDKAVDAARLAKDAGSAIQTITESIGHIRDMNNQIAAASEEQSVAGEEVSRNVVSMSELAKNAHRSASSTRTTTDGLEQTASDLNSIAAQFRL